MIMYNNAPDGLLETYEKFVAFFCLITTCCAVLELLTDTAILIKSVFPVTGKFTKTSWVVLISEPPQSISDQLSENKHLHLDR